MSALNRPASRSTELLHVVASPESSGGARRSWDSLVTENNAVVAGPSGVGGGGPNTREKSDRARFSVCSAGPSLTPSAIGNSPWFGGGTSGGGGGGGDQSPRILGTMPRNIIALLDRPVTYEEELEDRMGLLRISATTLFQRLASEKKKAVELAQQLNARELNYRGTVEKLRDQYDQRFDRMKNRARLLVTRCEFLRNEKQLVEQRLTQVIESSARERQGMERRISALQEEVERLKNEKEATAVPADVTSVDDDDDPDELTVLRVTEEQDVVVEETVGQGPVVAGRCSDHFRMLCEIAVARVAFLEHWIADPPIGQSTIREEHRFDEVHSLSRRSSSCPLIAVSSPLHLSDNESFISAGNNHAEEAHHCVLHVTEAEPTNPEATNRDDDRTGILRVKSYPPTSSIGHSSSSSSARNTRSSMPPTMGYPLPILPSTIRTSLQKLFHSGKPNHTESSSSSYSFQDTRISGVSGRAETPSDEELPRDITMFDARFKRPRPRSSKRGKSDSLPTSAKRHSSLPRTELFRKLQHGGRHDRELRHYHDYMCATLPDSSGPLTKQERVLGIRLNRSNGAADSGSQISSNNNILQTSSEYFPEMTSGGQLNSQTESVSTESLPDKVEGGFHENGTKIMKRNRSVHSTFGRLHQRRNGVANIERIEQKTSNRSSGSAFDNFGKNLKYYLH